MWSGVGTWLTFLCKTAAASCQSNDCYGHHQPNPPNWCDCSSCTKYKRPLILHVLNVSPSHPLVLVFLSLLPLSHVAAFLFPDDAVNDSHQPILGCSSHKAVGGWGGRTETEGTSACHGESRAIQHLPVQCQQLLCSRLRYSHYYQQIQWEEWWALLQTLRAFLLASGMDRLRMILL